MKKQLYNKIVNILDKNKVLLSYDIYTQKVYINNIKVLNKDIRMQSWFSLIKAKINESNDTEVLKLIIEIANEKQFNSNEDKIKAKEEEKQNKLEQKKEKEKQLEEDKKNKEKELEEFINNFDYNILNSLPKNTWNNTIKIMLSNKGLDSKPITCNRIITKHIIQKSLNEKEKYEKIGYILNSEDKIDDSLPVNYEVFFDNFFYKKEEWESLDKTKGFDRIYCWYDEWKDNYTYIKGNETKELTPERIRSIVRDYSPIKNVYVVNDMYKDWVKENRKDNMLINTIKSSKWDGIDRWGINNDSNKINNNENYICKALGADQTELNKKMVTYAFLHACRQILWPCRYNYQHVLSLLGDTNIGKTKVLQDMFTWVLGRYYCENLDLANDAEWTIGAKLSGSIAIIWNERKGINKAANDAIKSFIDIINGELRYQKKHEQAITTYISHNICMISYNPKQNPFLSDYSVSYEKRYHIIECKQTEEGFKKKYLHFIEDNREQMWAQLYEWCINNQNEVNELNENDINELKVIQTRNKGIDTQDIEDALYFWLNTQQYIADKIVDGEQIKNSKDPRFMDKAKYKLNFISKTAFKSLLSQISMDSRHNSLINTNNLLAKLGWKDCSKKINGHTYRGYCLVDSVENPILFD